MTVDKPSQIAPKAEADQPTDLVPAIDTIGLNVWYGDFQALYDVNLAIKKGRVTSLIGPSGCGKSTFLRSINRINERLGYVRIDGEINVFGNNIYAPEVELVQVRKQIGMVLLWDKVKDHLKRRATELSLEEQQKLCIARLLPVKPSILLMDEPCSALDPKGTAAVEELIWELRGDYSILIVTHNMAQARRASEECIFMLMGKVIEHTETAQMFVTPDCRETADYIEGRYG